MPPGSYARRRGSCGHSPLRLGVRVRLAGGDRASRPGGRTGGGGCPGVRQRGDRSPRHRLGRGGRGAALARPPGRGRGDGTPALARRRAQLSRAPDPGVEGHTNAFRWHVPDLPAEHARLLLRIGDEEGERVGALSRVFRILHTEGAPPPDLAFHEGLTWTGQEPTGAPVPSSITPATPGFESASDPVASGLPAPQSRAERLIPARMPVVDAGSVPAPTSPAALAVPREIPLRI